jgi:hypothetical protein
MAMPLGVESGAPQGWPGTAIAAGKNPKHFINDFP